MSIINPNQALKFTKAIVPALSPKLHKGQAGMSLTHITLSFS